MDIKVKMVSGTTFEITNADVTKEKFLEMVASNKINHMVNQNMAFVSKNVEIIEFNIV